tara:strand:+ start:67 stop:1239 length:1173 start_codon:yes stop_codon:yes gene_type:complete
MSTIKVNKIENTATADGGIAIDASGHVTVDGQQLPTAGALTGRRINLNGAMQVAQRGTSGTTTSSSAYLSVDRWKCTDGGQGDFTVSQSSTAPDGFANSVKWDCTTADTSITDEIYMEQSIEGQDLQQLGYGTSSAKSITISFWVRSNLTGQFGVWLENFDSSRYYTTSGYTINTADTWEHKTITIPGDTGGSGFGDDNGTGMKFRWHLALRSSYQGTPSGSWSTSASNRSQSSHVNLASSTANEWYLTGVQIEVGEKATPFEHRSYGDELARCKRYFELLTNDIGTGTKLSRKLFGPGYFESSSEAVSYVSFAQKRAAPTVTASGTSHFNMQHTGTSTAITALSFTQISPTDVRADTTTSSAPFSDGDSCFLTSISTSQLTTISVDAEL